ncbi:MAG: MoxR family ATPase [Methylococcales bacterium]
MTIPNIDINKIWPLPAVNTWRKSVHVFDEETVYAIRAALAADRPLLIRGEPGTGKSQLARAAAVALGRQFLCHVVTAHTEIQDLWYRFDAVSRLGDAQILGLGVKQQDESDNSGQKKTAEQKQEVTAESLLDPLKYLSPGIFWWAFDHLSARQYSSNRSHQAYHPDGDDDTQWNNGVVLLIDEIDKSGSDLPNSLLETLDNGKFSVPWVDHPIGINMKTPNPLVIITTNEDRQLPGAFLRRCLVLELSLPEQEIEQRQELIKRAAAHFDWDEAAIDHKREVLNKVAKQLYEDRQLADRLGVTPPGQAEFLDILHVLSKLADNNAGQLKLLDKIADFALKKFPDMKNKQGDSNT